MSFIRSFNLEKIYEYNGKGKISDEILKSFYERLPHLEKAIAEVERAAGIGYPPVYFDPVLNIISYPAAEFSDRVIYARWNVRQFGEGYRLCVDISLPFLLYAPEEILRACIAHEFLHYVFISLAIGNKQLESLSSDGIDAPEVHTIFDETHNVKAEDWLDSEELKEIVRKVFSPFIKELELERSIKEKWIELGLPAVRLSADEANNKPIPIVEVDRLPLDRKILEKAKTKPRSAMPTGQIF